MPVPRIILVAALLGGWASPSPAQDLPAVLQEPFEAGVQALKAGKLDEAEAAFLRVLEQGGKRAYVHNNLGLVYQQRRQHGKAAAQFREAIRLDPGYGAPRVGLGASLLALEQVGEATTQLEQAVKLLPREPQARVQLAQAFWRAGNWPGAVEQYRALRDLAPEDPEYAYQLGKAYLGLSEWCWRELRRVDPGSARLEQALGHNYRVQGRANLALGAFERAARVDPTLPDVHLALAQIYLEQKRWAEARQEIERELALVPESAGARALKQRLDAEEGETP